MRISLGSLTHIHVKSSALLLYRHDMCKKNEYIQRFDRSKLYMINCNKLSFDYTHPPFACCLLFCYPFEFPFIIMSRFM